MLVGLRILDLHQWFSITLVITTLGEGLSQLRLGSNTQSF